MRKVLLLLCVTLLLVSCGRRSSNVADIKPVVQQQSGMYALKLLQRNRLRFSGLLAVKLGGDGLEYVLLDASGVTLLAANVALDGTVKLKQAVAEMERKGFVGYFSTVVHRTFQLYPETLPCEGSFFHSFCLDGQNKTERFGPFLNWSYKKSDSQEKSFVYFQPFFGISIELKPM